MASNKNGDLTTEDVTVGSNKKVWWIGKCGHEWEAMVKERNRGYGCPICAGKRLCVGINDLESYYPGIAAQWDFERNAPLLPKMVLSKSHRKVWWICKEGHRYESFVDNRTRGRGCPYYNNKVVTVGKNDLKNQNSFLSSEYSDKNELSADDIFANSHRKV